MDTLNPMDRTSLEQDALVVRRLRPDDIGAVIALDARNTGKRREEYFKIKLDQAIAQVGTEVSLAAETDGIFVGFMISRIYYGEFGMTEQAAVLDSIGVHPDFRGIGIGRELLRQLRTNLLALNVTRLSTEASWDEPAILAFFQHEGFRPAPRFCVDLDLNQARRDEDTVA